MRANFIDEFSFIFLSRNELKIYFPQKLQVGEVTLRMQFNRIRSRDETRNGFYFGAIKSGRKAKAVPTSDRSSELSIQPIDFFFCVEAPSSVLYA